MASEKKLADEFAPVAKEYAKFRPHYPPELVTDLLAYFDANCKVPRAEAIALDVGTGSGQIAQPLAVAGFKEVHGIDKSAPQMKEAKQHPALIYRVGTDQQTGAADKTVALVTVAQAAHWFDLPKFYQEVRRISVPTATLSIIGYAICSVAEPAEVQPIFAAYYKSLDDYWPKECDRDLLDSGFASAAFPFQNESRKWYHQRTTMTLGTFLGYVRTWSALTMFKQKNPQTEEPSIALEKKLLTIPGLSNLDSPITISYPFFMINTTVQE